MSFSDPISDLHTDLPVHLSYSQQSSPIVSKTMLTNNEGIYVTMFSSLLGAQLWQLVLNLLVQY